MKIPFSDYLRSSCELAKEKMFLGLWKATGEYPCPGCAYEKTCQDRRDLTKKNTQKTNKNWQHKYETNAQIAARLGVTKRQVSKMRARGEL